MNCHPTLCGMLVDVEDGVVTGVRGDPDNPASRGFLCQRGQASREIIGNPLRLLAPRIRERRGRDRWRDATWDEALDLIAARFSPGDAHKVGLWGGHGSFANNYGTRVSAQLLRRLANLTGAQWWSPTSICWGFGAFGIGLTGLLETNAKQDLEDHADLVVLWGATFASQPTTAPHVVRARKRGARVIAIDVRQSDAARHADELIIVRPGTDAALALAVAHVVVRDDLVDHGFCAANTVGYDELAGHVAAFDPGWAERETGVPAATIERLARTYAATRPAMIVLGGSSMYKDAQGWLAARAISCLPALTGNVGIAGGGLGPRHGGQCHGFGLADITLSDRRVPGPVVPDQMSEFTAAMLDRRVTTMLLFGSNVVSSFPASARVREGLATTDLVVVHDLFPSETARELADVVLPATSWLEETGCKATAAHLHLMPQVLEPPGETRSVTAVLRALAERIGVDGYWPWEGDDGALDAILDHPCTDHATVAALRAEGGCRPLRVSPVGHPTLQFPTPSGKLELSSQRAVELGLPALPIPAEPAPVGGLALRNGRTLTHFHGFYDHGRALPSLARADPEPVVWIAPDDAAARGIEDGAQVEIASPHGRSLLRAMVTDRVPPGTMWSRSGWEQLNRLTSDEPSLPDAAVGLFSFSAGQAAYAAPVEVGRARLES
jgi:anaerobic selenocysteine-containing dehydrogenase